MKPWRISWLSLAILLSSLNLLSGAPTVAAPTATLVTEGDLFKAQGKFTEALWAYRQAANTGNVAAAWGAGDLLLTQAQAVNGRERALQWSQGLSYLFFAATNHHAQACLRLAEAFEKGLGMPSNLVTAYAWLTVAAKFNPALKPGLDHLAVRMEPTEILQAQQTAAEYLRGHWPNASVFALQQGDARLQLQGLCLGKSPLATLNGKTFGAGDTLDVPLAKSARDNSNKRLNVSCLEIGSDYILLAVAGEPNRILLSTNVR